MRRMIPAAAGLLSFVLLVCAMLTPSARMQEIVSGPQPPMTAMGSFHPAASNLIIPQSRVYALRAQARSHSDQRSCRGRPHPATGGDHHPGRRSHQSQRPATGSRNADSSS